ncbi:MAG: hypothetical protein KDC73_04090 [Ignavibacteriae bacterium]|nr:hypothetical protein [Ignavibacteriota bacterium]MCB0723856.1 hypothetical protein [Ignavibacteriota bacterium]MCB9244099.1 hypothetical protein [Ignavibacteriales bacterium]
MLKDFIRGFIFMFVLLMVYLIAVNFILMYSAEGLGLYKNIPLFIGLAIFLNVAPFIVITIIDRIKKKKLRAEADEFMKYGTRANAKITGIADTGITINDDPVVRLTMEINPDSSGTFTKTADVTVSRVTIPRVGDIIRVIYDPKDPTKFSVEQ